MIRIAGVAFCLAVLVAGCASGGAGGPAGSDGQTAVQLDGRTFLSTAVTQNGAPRQLVEGTRIRLRFGEGRLNADAGCNQLSGEYTVDGTALAVGQLAMTEMACMPAARAEQDTWLADLLGSRPTISLNGDTLVLTGESSQVTLLDRQVADPDRVLVGPRWRVETIIKGDVASSTPGEAESHFTFGAGGRVTGSTGCNQFSGAYQATADTLIFSQVGMTKEACPGAVNALELAVTVLFDGRPVPYRIEANQLTLTYPNGTGGLQLRVAE
jgi:heat shock protein HslJ